MDFLKWLETFLNGVWVFLKFLVTQEGLRAAFVAVITAIIMSDPRIPENLKQPLIALIVALLVAIAGYQSVRKTLAKMLCK